jgi:hypothetical protein
MRFEGESLNRLELELSCWVILLGIVHSDVDDALYFELAEFTVSIERTTDLLFNFYDKILKKRIHRLLRC